MSAFDTKYAKSALDAISDAFLPEIKYIGIQTGGTEKSRQYTHIFVPGEIYGGALGKLLCGRAWGTKHIYSKSKIANDVCPQCKDALRKLAAIVADAYPQELFDIAGGALVIPISKGDIKAALEELAAREKAIQDRELPIPMFSEEEIGVVIRREPLWKIPHTEISTR